MSVPDQSHSDILTHPTNLQTYFLGALKATYLKLPNTGDEWRQIASDFYSAWNFSMCLGALDGKRVLIAKPRNSGSEYYGYKGHFSMIMLALGDANYKFLYVDVGACGRASDGGVWDKCSLKEAVAKNLINIPKPHNIPFSNRQCPYVIVDDAFRLKPYLMKPYPGRDLTSDFSITVFLGQGGHQKMHLAYLHQDFRFFSMPLIHLQM